jgi:diadenosine tetraphosphatase ApaH/serine/threonine PP2A family protein phosphatase
MNAPTLPEGLRLYAVGDVHGRLDLLEALHDLIAADAAKSKAAAKRIVYLGDYLDRGPDSKGVIELLLKPPPAGFERVILKGNHEDVTESFLTDLSVAEGWFAYGGIETLKSYGVAPPRHAGEIVRVQAAFAAALPDSHRRLFKSLQLTHRAGGYFFTHAGVKPGVALDRQEEEDLLWIRDEFLRSDQDFGAMVVHGHTITPAPVTRANRIGIDTGAFFSGRLTALVLEGGDHAFIQT